MAQLVIENKTLGIAGIACLVAIAVAATIGYNLGYGRGALPQPQGTVASPATELGTPEQPGTPATPTLPSADVPEEVSLSVEPVEVAGKTLVSGRVASLTAKGFTLEVMSETFNTQTRSVTQKTTTYQVATNASTKVVTQTSTITIAHEGAVPQVKTTTRTGTVSLIKEGQTVTVTTNDPLTAKVLTALEVRLTTVVQP